MTLPIFCISILFYTTTVLQACESTLQQRSFSNDSQVSQISHQSLTPAYEESLQSTPKTSPHAFKPASDTDTTSTSMFAQPRTKRYSKIISVMFAQPRTKRYSKIISVHNRQTKQEKFWNFENKLLLLCATVTSAVFYAQGITPFK